MGGCQHYAIRWMDKDGKMHIIRPRSKDEIIDGFIEFKERINDMFSKEDSKER